MAIVLVVTYKCNFRCVYCFEKGSYLLKKHMPMDILKKACNWCIDYVKRNYIETLHVTPFGGEPLLNFDAIKYILDFFSEHNFQEKEINFYMSTNGFLLSPEKARYLISKGLKSFQITLDGLPDIHNKRRSGGKDSFSIIWENIINLVKLGGFVELLFVGDMENVDYFIPLIDFLKSQAKELPLLLEHLRIQGTLTEPVEACMERSKKYILGKEIEIADKLLEGLKYAKESGFKICPPYYSNICLRQLYNGFLISIDGGIYKCYSAGGNPRYKIGNLDTPLENIMIKANEWADLKTWDDECRDCYLFPLCRGGLCQYSAAQFHNGEYGHKLCEKELITYTIKKALEYGLYEVEIF